MISVKSLRSWRSSAPLVDKLMLYILLDLYSVAQEFASKQTLRPDTYEVEHDTYRIGHDKFCPHQWLMNPDPRLGYVLLPPVLISRDSHQAFLWWLRQLPYEISPILSLRGELKVQAHNDSTIPNKSCLISTRDISPISFHKFSTTICIPSSLKSIWNLR